MAVLAIAIQRGGTAKTTTAAALTQAAAAEGRRVLAIYHGISAEETDKAQLIGLIEGMTAAQMQQLTGIARALRGA